MRPGEQVSRLATVDPADQRFLVVQPLDEKQLFAERKERLQQPPEVHLGAFTPGPPLPAMEPVPGEQAGETHRRLRGTARRLVTPDRERFQPRQGHGHADPAKEAAAGDGIQDGGGHWPGFLEIPLHFEPLQYRSLYHFDQYSIGICRTLHHYTHTVS